MEVRDRRCGAGRIDLLDDVLELVPLRQSARYRRKPDRSRGRERGLGDAIEGVPF